MSDIEEKDQTRILLYCRIGGVQAWGAPVGDVAIALSFYANFSHTPDDMRSYTSATHNFTIADARNIAAVLTRAADHAESVQTVAEAA